MSIIVIVAGGIDGGGDGQGDHLTDINVANDPQTSARDVSPLGGTIVTVSVAGGQLIGDLNAGGVAGTIVDNGEGEDYIIANVGGGVINSFVQL